MNQGVTLVCKEVMYYSLIDEDMLFEWLKRIPSIIKIDGRHDELYLHIKSCKISNRDLRALISLFYRYKIDMKQLQIFLNDNNREWLMGNPKGYWYRRMFGESKKVK